MELAREAAPLVLLDTHVLARETPVGVERRGELALGFAAARELGAYLGHATPCEERGRQRDEHQHAGQLVDLVVLVRQRHRKEQLAQVQPDADHSEGDRRDDDDDEVARSRITIRAAAAAQRDTPAQRQIDRVPRRLMQEKFPKRAGEDNVIMTVRNRCHASRCSVMAAACSVSLSHNDNSEEP
ncbi:MAG: hypothetical protein ABW071_12235 [Casimicrobiaceae bacterium]